MAKAANESASMKLDVQEEEEKEVTLDVEMIKAAFLRMGEAQGKLQVEQRKVTSALAKIKVTKEDVKLVQEQLGLPKDQAELLLKKSGGCAEQCFSAYISEPAAEPVPLV